ncbi:hypothetical protein FMUND_6914 [Fusarium mundagurra]|uniref:HTH CENPB-type domain-containing protein n=1 Tax=Fusarium mundagurra TaxID=1567541 RepID=A0A8H6DF86_9HYPO|nr:hypothetical protein FMUND_6914 [Fusarium mundagurra]
MASRLGINLTGRVFSVTGGASGMGLATATLLARHGAAAVWIADPQTARFDSARAQITAANSSTDVHLEAVDVSDSKQVDSWIERIVSKSGGLHGSANVAGLPQTLKIPNGPNLLGETDDLWRKIMSVNLDGVMYCTRAQVRAMVSMEKGSNPAIVNVSSMGAINHGGALYAYTTSKAGCEHFTRNAAKDVFPYGIRINGVLPGNTTTPMSDQFFEGLPQEMRDQIMEKAGLSSSIQPEDIARAVVWLLSENSLTVNGEEIIVKFILDLDSRGFPPRLRGVEEMTNRLLADRDASPVGKRWAMNFVKRHQELKTRFFRKYDYQRAKCEDPNIIRNWFRLVENTIAKYGIRSDDIWNFDETGFMMGVIASGMVVTGAERRGKPKSVQPGNREWITVIQAINAEGRAIPLFIIGSVQYHLANWYRENNLPGDWAIATSQNGWTDNEMGL